MRASDVSTETMNVESSRGHVVPCMRRGDLIDNRFEIVEFAGAGGMGTVYRALDRTSHMPVALKVLRNPSGSDAMRFAHETRVLAGLHHPHIVRHVADGIAPDGEPYLAMEWLEGESLAFRLSRKGLQLDESVDLARRVASALGAAHAKGIVHRDVKPSNIFLLGGRVEDVKVLDFGIARRVEATMALTRTGGVVGTPGYIAPEQARGERGELDARADVFSLGCVLFECLTGRPAFVGMHALALLAKLLMEEVPRVRALNPEISEALDALVGRMLAKKPADRPADGAAVVTALDELGALDGRASTQPPRVEEVITGTETRLVSVVVLVPNAAGGCIEPTSSGVFGSISRKLLGDVRRAVEPFGASVEELACGVLVAMIVGAGNPTDQAALGARAALCMRELVPDAALVLLAGRGSDTGSLPVGEVLERAASLVSAAAAQGSEHRDKPPIRLDEVTRALLDVRFDVVVDNGQALLLRQREVGTDARTLLGKPSPFVGRDRELRMLVDFVEGSFEESRARAVLLTGLAGMGKSRLCYEFLRKLRDGRCELAIAMGRGDSVSAGSAFGVLATTFRNSLGIAAGEPIEVQRDKLARSVRAFVPEPDRQRVMEFLGEMIGTPFPDDSSPKLRAARQDASIMADQLQTAYLDFTTAVASTRPVLLVLEDLHWGDAPSVKLIDAALRQLKNKPFIVVAFARPEVHARFPKLWEERDIQEIRIRELSRRAAENLVKSILGAKGEEKVAALVDRAAGNAFYLEELIRAVAEGRGDALPETVLGMVEARLAVLDADARRLLRAASIFGETFWRRGVRLLLGDEASIGGNDRLAALVEQEVLVRHAESRLAGEEEYAFRHALLREGAYAMLTERDRVLGHKLAGEWLEQAGEKNPKLLAEHFDRGAERARAALHYARAAEQALDGGDCEGAIKLAERGIACAPEPERIAELRAVEAEARYRNGDLEGSARAAAEALELARPGSRSECRALGTMIGAALFLRNIFMLKEPMERLLRTNPDPDAIALFVQPFVSVISALAFMAQRGLMELYLRRIEHVTAAVIPHDSIAVAGVELTRSLWAAQAERDVWAMREHAQRALFHFERSGAMAFLPVCHVWLANAYAHLGFVDHAEEHFSRAVFTVSGAGRDRLIAEGSRAAMLLDQRKLDEASEVAAWVIQEAAAQGDLLQGRIGRLHLVEAHLYKGTIDAAESEALALGEDTAAEPYFGMWYLAVLAAIRLAQGRAREASEMAERAFAQSQACGMGFPSRHAMLLLVRAEALHALGDHPAACRAIREARDDLLRRADKIPDSDVRRSFLENLPDHRRTLDLARQWLGQDGQSSPGS